MHTLYMHTDMDPYTHILCFSVVRQLNLSCKKLFFPVVRHRGVYVAKRRDETKCLLQYLQQIAETVSSSVLYQNGYVLVQKQNQKSKKQILQQIQKSTRFPQIC